MTEPLAEVRDYPQLLEALRARVEHLGITLDQVDDIGGLPTRYATKILAKVKIPQRKLGLQSLGPILGVLGVKLILVQDEEMLQRIAHRLRERKRPQSLADADVQMLTLKRQKRRGISPLSGNPELARLLRARATLTRSPKQRSSQAKKAARARWHGLRPRRPG